MKRLNYILLSLMALLTMSCEPAELWKDKTPEMVNVYSATEVVMYGYYGTYSPRVDVYYTEGFIIEENSKGDLLKYEITNFVDKSDDEKIYFWYDRIEPTTDSKSTAPETIRYIFNAYRSTGTAVAKIVLNLGTDSAITYEGVGVCEATQKGY